MAHDPFTVFPRTRKNGQKVYYVRFRDPQSGRRMTPRSTNLPSKAAAKAWAAEQWKQGVFQGKASMSFAQYAEYWWVWGRCPYIEKKRARGQQISRAYADNNRQHLVRYILPYFGEMKLSKINCDLVEAFQMSLIKSSEEGKHLSPKTANNILSTLIVILREAFRLGDLPTNPTSSTRKLADKPKETELLSIAEVRKLFDQEKIDTVWSGDRRHRTPNELALHTGARIGEIQALKQENIHEGYIDISATWGRKYGLKDPKWGSIRKVPIPRNVIDDLSELVQDSPYTEPHDFVFHGGDPTKPLDHKTIYEVLYKAFAAIGIAENERRRRNITFHSWRYYLNTFMRGKVADAKLRRVTGHKTQAMTERYTNFSLEDFDDLAKCQQEILA